MDYLEFWGTFIAAVAGAAVGAVTAWIVTTSTRREERRVHFNRALVDLIEAIADEAPDLRSAQVKADKVSALQDELAKRERKSDADALAESYAAAAKLLADVGERSRRQARIIVLEAPRRDLRVAETIRNTIDTEFDANYVPAFKRLEALVPAIVDWRSNAGIPFNSAMERREVELNS